MTLDQNFIASSETVSQDTWSLEMLWAAFVCSRSVLGPARRCVQLVSVLFLALTNRAGHHLQHRSCLWYWVMGSPGNCLEKIDGWLGEIKNTREVDGNLPESIPPVTVVSSPQRRLVELKVKLLHYWKWWTLLTLGKTQVWRWWWGNMDAESQLPQNEWEQSLAACPSFHVQKSLAEQCHNTDHTGIPAVNDGCHWKPANLPRVVTGLLAPVAYELKTCEDPEVSLRRLLYLTYKNQKFDQLVLCLHS